MSNQALTRLSASLREMARAVAELAEAEEWIDQKSSPLGRRQHCEAARSGSLKAKKLGNRWLARRADVDAYIEAHGTKAPAERAEPDDATAIAKILEFRAPRRKRSGGRGK